MNYGRLQNNLYSNLKDKTMNSKNINVDQHFSFVSASSFSSNEMEPGSVTSATVYNPSNLCFDEGQIIKNRDLILCHNSSSQDLFHTHNVCSESDPSLTTYDAMKIEKDVTLLQTIDNTSYGENRGNNENKTIVESSSVLSPTVDNGSSIETSDYLFTNDINLNKQNQVISATVDNVKVGKSIYQCSKCSFSTKKRKKFRAHWTAHEDKKFQCEICKKEFVNLGTLKRHQLTHTDRKYYLCDVCGRGYLHIISLKYHKLGHLQHNPIAGERTKRIQEKKNRVGEKIQDKPKKFLCDLCGKIFKQAVSLKTHRLKHEQDSSKLFSTGKTTDFDYEEYLNKRRPGPKRKHLLVSEKKRFKCSECPYTAARSRDVVVHLRTHTGEKPFPCNICGKFFSKESVVERHKLTHSFQNTQSKTVDHSNNGNNNPSFYNGKNKNIPDLYPINKHAVDTVSRYGDYFGNVNNLEKNNYTNGDGTKGNTAAVKNETKFISEIKLKYPYFDDNNSRIVDSFNEFGQNCGDDLEACTKGFIISNTYGVSKAGAGTDSGVPAAQEGVNQNATLQRDLHSDLSKEADREKDDALCSSEFREKTQLTKNPAIDLDPIEGNSKYLANVNNSQCHLQSNILSNYTQDNLINNITAMENKDHNSDYKVRLNNNLNLENTHTTFTHFPHVIRLDGREVRSFKKEKKVSKPKVETKKRVKGVKVKHKCEQCPYETFLSRDMRVHMRKHSGERPFPCPICGKRFTKESVVKRHQSVHTGLRPYSCEYCYKTFSQQSNLKTHKIAHFDITTGLLKNNIKHVGDMTDRVEANYDVIKTELKDNIADICISNSSGNQINSDTKVTKKRKTNNKCKDIEVVNVDENIVKCEIDFQFKIEDCPSDDECLSKVKENILSQGCGIEVDVGNQPDCDIKMELADVDDWQNDDIEYKDEFKENVNKLDNIPTDINIKIDEKENNAEADRLERKRLKKLKKKMEKLKRKTQKLEDNCREYLPRNKNKEGKKDIFKCNECHYSVVNKRDLIVHMRSHSGEKLFSCDICLKKFSKQSVVNRHKLIHFGIRPYTCHLCSLTFTQSNSLKKHVEVKHGLEEKDLPFKCDICPATFAQEKSLKTHKHVHLRKKHNEFTCHVCGKVFPHECRLKSHLLLHNERQFHCMVCSKKFLRKYDLKYHLLIHTQEKQCVCHVCGGVFSTPATLKMHLRSHLSPTQFACCTCNENFTTAADLSQHKLTVHKGEKSFQCTKCDKFFSQASGLKKHELTHSTCRPHQCMICWKHFKLLGHLHKHYNTTKHGTITADHDTMKSDIDVNL